MSAEQDARQTIDKLLAQTDRAVRDGPPGEPIDAIEYGRGQLAALTYVSGTSAREVHVLRLRSSFNRARIAHKLRYSLSVLELMREVQELEGGYWFPTPLRVVPINEQALLIAPVPTRELQRHFRGVTRAGYARSLRDPDAPALPTQELDEWLRLDVRDSVAWSDAQIANARAGMGPTISSGNVQFFSLVNARLPFGTTTSPAWIDDPRFGLSSQKGVVLCRERAGGEYVRHFLARVEGARVVAEGPTPRDVARMQFGLAALAGKPITVTIVSREGESVFHFPTSLPRPERQLMLALGVRDLSLPGKAYRVRGAPFISVVRETLAGLGCEVRAVRV